jgi:hypothetical protein
MANKLHVALVEARHTLRHRVWHRAEVTITAESLQALVDHASKCPECVRLDWLCESCKAKEGSHGI